LLAAAFGPITTDTTRSGTTDTEYSPGCAAMASKRRDGTPLCSPAVVRLCHQTTDHPSPSHRRPVAGHRPSERLGGRTWPLPHPPNRPNTATTRPSPPCALCTLRGRAIECERSVCSLRERNRTTCSRVGPGMAVVSCVQQVRRPLMVGCFVLGQPPSPARHPRRRRPGAAGSPAMSVPLRRSVCGQGEP
jgi:hypothetical protein